MLRAYVHALLVVIVFPPFVVLRAMEQETGASLVILSVIAPLSQLSISAAFFLDAVKRVRYGNIPRPAIATPVVTPVPETATAGGWGPGWSDVPPTKEGRRPVPAELYLPDLPPIDDEDPVRWKEQHVVGRRAYVEQARNPARSRIAVVLLGFLAGCLILVGAGRNAVLRMKEATREAEHVRYFLQHPPPTGHPDSSIYATPKELEVGAALTLLGGALSLALYLVPAALAMTPIIARERRQATLDPLLTLPLDRHDILWAKVCVVMRRGWGWAALAAAAISLTFATERGWRHGVAAADAMLGGVAMVGGLAAWLSVRCPTEIRALRLLLPAVVVAFGAPIAVWHWAITEVAPHVPLVGLFASGALFSAIGLLAFSRAFHEFDRLQ
jgi:hypothetical protein